MNYIISIRFTHTFHLADLSEDLKCEHRQTK